MPYTLPGRAGNMGYNPNTKNYISTLIWLGGNPKTALAGMTLDWGGDTCIPGNFGVISSNNLSNPILDGFDWLISPPEEDDINVGNLYLIFPPNTDGQLTNIGNGAFTPTSSIGGYFIDGSVVTIVPYTNLASTVLNLPVTVQSTDSLSRTSQVYVDVDGNLYFQAPYVDAPAIGRLFNTNLTALPTVLVNTVYAMQILLYGGPLTIASGAVNVKTKSSSASLKTLEDMKKSK